MGTDETNVKIGNQDMNTNHLPAIIFRPFEPSESDFSAIMAFGSDERIIRFLQFDLFRCRDDAVRFVQTFVLPHPWFRFICLAGAGDHPAGMIVLRPHDAGGGRCTVMVGFSVVPELWGRGIATAAVRTVTQVAVEEWTGVERVEAVTFLDNRASQRVLEKAGFQREAVLRRYMISKGEATDVVMYSFLCTDRRFSEYD